MATAVGGQAMDKADILNTLREVSQVTNSSNSSEIYNMTGLLKQCQTWSGQTRAHTRNQRRLANQHRTGIISWQTLLEILKIGSEDLGSNFLMCREDDTSTNN